MRQTLLINNEIYHIYNRGVDKRHIFLDEQDHQRFADSLVVFNNQENLNGQRFKDRVKFENEKPLVNVIAYCLMPNHFHLLLEQQVDNGVEKFIHKMATSYTMYFNKKYTRTGILLQGVFKRSHIKSNGRLLEISRYIHSNPVKILDSNTTTIPIKDKLLAYPWSSFPDYADVRTNTRIVENKEIIMDQFSTPNQYIDYVVGEAYDNGG